MSNSEKLETLKSTEIRPATGLGRYSSNRNKEYIYTKILEEECSNEKSEEKKISEDELKTILESRGLEENEIGRYLEALEKNNPIKKDNVILNAARRLEYSGEYIRAAEEYFELGDYDKVLSVLLKGGHKSLNDGKEFMLALDLLIELGGEEKESALKISEEIKAMIDQREEDEGWWDGIYNSYRYLGQCLHLGEKNDEAFEAFKSISLEEGKQYLISIGEWEKVAYLQKKIINREGLAMRNRYLDLAEYYRKAGMKKEEGDALWQAGSFYESAKTHSDLTGDQSKFFKAIGEYSNIRENTQKDFLKDIWQYFNTEILEVFSENSYKEEQLVKLNNLLKVVYSAYGLSLPDKMETDVNKSTNFHRKKVQEFLDDFALKKKNIKSKDAYFNFLSNSYFSKILEHAVLGKVSVSKVCEITKRAFNNVKYSHINGNNLAPKAQEFWTALYNEEIDMIGTDLLETCALCYEAIGNYEQAKDLYLQANLPEEAKRLENNNAI